jgi:hypothetical protein
MVRNTEEPTALREDFTARMRGPAPRLILGSALMLFLELALIRWLGPRLAG